MAENDFLRDVAWRFLLEQKIGHLPVDSIAVAKSRGYSLFTYLEFCRYTGTEIARLMARSEDGFTFWSARDSRFVIVYNSDKAWCVIRWTLMHEIGHIYLGHISPGCPAITRVRTPYRSMFERAAQGFARRVLCPSIVLHDCKAFTPGVIARLCGISDEAAGYRAEYIRKLEERNAWYAHPLEREVERQFSMFIARYIIRKAKYEGGFNLAAEICA